MIHIPNSVTRAVFRSGLHVKKAAPNIMFAGGIVGVLGSTVLACRATLQLADALPEMRKELEQVREHVEVTDAEDGRLIAYVYAKNIAHVAKLYAPAALVGVAGIGALTGSHITLNRRNAAVTAAYATVSKAYDEYRERVRDELGDKRELDLYHGAETHSAKNEQGKVEKFKVVDGDHLSPYARLFDEFSPNWSKNSEYNMLFIKCQQTYSNDILRARGHIFLNEVYDALGLDRTKEGQIVGWVWQGEGDNYIDFGLHEVRNQRFLSGWERSVLLDFNVDGNIYDKI